MSSASEGLKVVGTRPIRPDGVEKVIGRAQFGADMVMPGMLWGKVKRSPHAHARIKSIDTSKAAALPGVKAVITAADFPNIASEEAFVGEGPMNFRDLSRNCMASDKALYDGHAVAAVAATSPAIADEALDLIEVEYEPLPAVLDMEAALAEGSPKVHEAGNKSFVWPFAQGDLDAAFRDAPVVVERTYRQQRLIGCAMEPRAVVCEPVGDEFTLWTSTQIPHVVRVMMALVTGIPEHKLRIVAPDVGGGFGAKIATERDTIIVAWAAKHTGRPVRWVETRNENLLGMVHGRAQRHTITIGGTRDGRILAYHLDIVQDSGAYPRGATFLPGLTQLMASGVYDLPYCGAAFRSMLTNTTPIGAYRGAGRPEATAAIERAVDLFAAEIGMDPAEVRRRNVVAPGKFPYTTASGAVYDTGEYAAALDAVLAGAGYDELRAEQARRREDGGPVQLGIGLATYVEITAGDGGGETSRVVVDPTGAATVYTGSSPHGQGHQTAFAMLVTDQLGIPMDQITVIHGDTDQVPTGIGTFGSRSLQLGGTAVHQATIAVKDQAREVAAGMIEASADDLELDTGTGTWQVRGDPDTALTWAEVAAQAGPAGLAADVEFRADRPTFPFGAHLAVVEVDTQTGKATLIRHITVDDAGKVLNPVLAEGQRHGGIAQGAAQALLEEVLYDAEGNPLTSTLADYAAITATELPSFELLAMETPTSMNALGVKGIGEAGTIGATPAVHNAVIDAVAHLGVRHIDMPATPQRVWAAITEAKGSV